jgi:hypothetical protein
MLNDSIGSNFLLILSVLAASVSARSRGPIFVGALLFLGSLLVFPNLQAQHRYYEYSISIFAIFGMSAAIWGLGNLSLGISERVGWLAKAGGIAVLFLVIGTQLTMFLQDYWPVVLREPRAARTLDLADDLKKTTSSQDAILVFGFDWSSEVAYYSERRTVAFPGRAGAIIPTNISEVSRFIGPERLGAIVDCPATRSYGPERWRIDQLESGLKYHRVGDCMIFLPNPPPDLKSTAQRELG